MHLDSGLNSICWCKEMGSFEDFARILLVMLRIDALR